jgi:uncharacterized protein YggE
MKKIAIIVLLVVLLGMMACSPSPEGITFPKAEVLRMVSSQQVGIWVTGEGEARAVPDIFLLRLGVESQATRVSEAQRQAAEVMDRVRESLTDSGVKEKDIQTYRFTIQPVRQWNRQTEQEVLIGYRVSNMVLVKIREIEKAGGIIDAVVGTGGDLIRIDSISFDIDDPTPYYEEAREKAVKDAEARAKQLADVAGVKLGKPIYISEGRGSTPSPTVYMERAAAPALPSTPISPGELEIRLTVQIAFDIGE